MPPWDDYDAWEARDRTLLEAAAMRRERLLLLGNPDDAPHDWIRVAHDVAQHRAQTREEVAHAVHEAFRVGPRDPARYRSPSPDMETT